MTILEYLEHPTSRIPSTIVDKIYYSLNYNDQLLVWFQTISRYEETMGIAEDMIDYG